MSSTASKPPIVLIHGMWMTPLSWEHWASHYTDRGHRVLAPAWPGLDKEPEELRRDPSPLRGLSITDVVDHYDREVHSPSVALKLPSVIALKEYVPAARRPAFTRFNVFLRDRFVCQYCHAHDDLTFDHIIPRSKGGQTTWETWSRPVRRVTCARET